MSELYDLIIIGSGPAGLTAGIYAQRAKLNTIIIEKNALSGGQVLTTYEVDNYPGMKGIGGFDLGTKMREHADELGAIFVEDEVVKIEEKNNYKVVTTTEHEYSGKTIIIANGATHAKLGVPGEEDLLGMGVSYCATCDGAFFRGKTVAVIGGGDVAVEDAIYLARFCQKVYLIHRRDELRAAMSLQTNLKQLENVEIIWDSIVTEIKGNDQVEGIKIKNKKTEVESDLALQGVFVAVGIRPNIEEMQHPLKMDGGGYIVAGEDTKTSEPGIFACGDVRTKPLRQIVTAVADGANAVNSVQNYLLHEFNY